MSSTLTPELAALLVAVDAHLRETYGPRFDTSEAAVAIAAEGLARLDPATGALAFDARAANHAPKLFQHKSFAAGVDDATKIAHAQALERAVLSSKIKNAPPPDPFGYPTQAAAPQHATTEETRALADRLAAHDSRAALKADAAADDARRAELLDRLAKRPT